MVFKNLFRRKGRTILTIVGIAIGMAAIVALGAMADSMRAGYGAIATGSKADPPCRTWRPWPAWPWPWPTVGRPPSS